MVTASSKKRKTIQLVDGDAEAEDVDLATTLKAFIKRSDERHAALVKKVEELSKMNPFDQSLEAIAKASDDDEEDLSDDEESIVDESDKWAIMFRQLREHKIISGDCKVSMKENSKLGYWVQDQKKYYNNAKGGGKGQKIKPERIIKLDSLGFNWGQKYPAPPSWDEQFEKLHNYQQQMGNCNVPFNEANPNALAKWAAYQRAEFKRFKKGKDSLLTLDQIGALKGIGFKWKGPKL
jgi:hypothetical protein